MGLVSSQSDFRVIWIRSQSRSEISNFYTVACYLCARLTFTEDVYGGLQSLNAFRSPPIHN